MGSHKTEWGFHSVDSTGGKREDIPTTSTPSLWGLSWTRGSMSDPRYLWYPEQTVWLDGTTSVYSVFKRHVTMYLEWSFQDTDYKIYRLRNDWVSRLEWQIPAKYFPFYKSNCQVQMAVLNSSAAQKAWGSGMHPYCPPPNFSTGLYSL